MDTFHISVLALLVVSTAFIAVLVLSGRRGTAKAPAGGLFAGATKTLEGALGHLGSKPSTKGETIDTLENLRTLLVAQGVVTPEATAAIDTIELAVLHTPKPAAAPAPSAVTGA